MAKATAEPKVKTRPNLSEIAPPKNRAMVLASAKAEMVNTATEILKPICVWATVTVCEKSINGERVPAMNKTNMAQKRPVRIIWYQTRLLLSAFCEVCAEREAGRRIKKALPKMMTAQATE